MKIIFGIIGTVRKFLVTGLLIASVAFNAALLVSTSLYTVANGIVSSITSTKSLAAQHADDIARVDAELVAERKLARETKTELASVSADLSTQKNLSRELKTELTSTTAQLSSSRKAVTSLNTELTNTSAELTTSRAATRNARNELANTSAELTTSRAATRIAQQELTDIKSGAHYKRINRIADRVTARGQRSAAKNIASMPAEGIPFWGTAIIVVATGAEIYDLCQTAIDMQELKYVFNPSERPTDEELTVCNIQVPSREDIIDYAKTAPGDVYDSVKENFPTSADDLPELPDIDWSSMDDWFSKKGNQLGDWWNK
jgi:vacuolar-type H+-ATPase subunit I/STV1